MATNIVSPTSEKPVTEEPVTDVHNPAALIAHWQRDHLITDEQATMLREDVERVEHLSPTPTIRPGRVAGLVVEALGYLGGVIIIVAVGLVVGRFWDGIPDWVRLLGAATITGLLVLAAMLAPAERTSAGERLRSVLLTVATITAGGTAAIFAYGSLGWREEPVAIAATSTAVVFSAVAWHYNRYILQHIAFFVSVCATVALDLVMIPEPPRLEWSDMVYYAPPATEALPGLGVWCVGVVWLLLAWGGVVKPRTIGFLLGAVAMVFGAAATGPQTWGLWLGVATVVAVIALAVYLHDFVLLIIGALGTLQVLPQLVTELFPGVLAAAGVLLLVGLALIAAAVVIARTRFGAHKQQKPVRYRTLPSVAMLTVMIGVVASVAVVTILVAVHSLNSTWSASL